MSCDAKRVVSVRQERYRTPCGSRYCPACGKRWAKDQRIRAVAAAKGLPGDCALITVTGPGNEYFAPPGRQTRAAVRARKGLWNRSARERWSSLHREASREARRTARENGCDWRLLYRTWEWQRRRVLHNHVVVPYGTPEEVAATDAYVQRLHELAPRWGFGFILTGEKGATPTADGPAPVKRMDVNAVAAYVSKYVSKAGDSRNGMVGVARAAGMRGSVLYVAQHLLRDSGVSMTTLRNRRRIVGRYPFARTGRRGWQEAVLVDSVQRGRAPLTQTAVETIRGLAGRGVPGHLWDRATGEVLALTRAPEPPGLAGHEPYAVDPRRGWGVGLASVLLRVPEPEDLGWIRTEVTDVAVVAV